MSRSWSRRLVATMALTALVAGLITLVGVGFAGACEELQIQISGTARGYDVSKGAFSLTCYNDPTPGLFLDGIITNDTTITVVPDHVRVSWVQNPARHDDEWICSGPIAVGEWAAFHMDWPEGVPTTWTPVVTGYAWPSDGDDRPLALTVTHVSSATTDEAGARTYAVTVSNPNDFPVSSLDVNAIERETSSTHFVDTLNSCPPDFIAANASVEFDMTGLCPWVGALSTDMRVGALEQPSLALSASNDSPPYGSPVTFRFALTHSDGSPATGDRTLKLLASRNGEDWCGDEWCGDEWCVDTDTGNASLVVVPERPTYFKAVYWGGDDLGWTESAVIYVHPDVTAVPPAVPQVVKAGHMFPVHGRMSAGAKSAGKPVTVITERKSGSHWTRTGTAKANPDSAGRWGKAMKVSTAGSYRVRAYRAGVGYSKYSSLRATR